MSDNITNLEKQITDLQEEIDRLKWVKNLKVGEEVLIKNFEKWLKKGKIVYCCYIPGEYYNYYFAIRISDNNTEDYFNQENGTHIKNNKILYPPTKENLESFEKQNLIEQIKAINFEEVNNDKLQNTLDTLEVFYDENKEYTSLALYRENISLNYLRVGRI